jgi:hypothetical protein
MERRTGTGEQQSGGRRPDATGHHPHVNVKWIRRQEPRRIQRHHKLRQHWRGRASDGDRRNADDDHLNRCEAHEVHV